MSKAKPVYVNHRSWFSFLFGVVLTAGTMFFDYTTALPGSNPYMFLDLVNPAIDLLDFIMFGLILIGLFFVFRLLKSNRIEFYDNFARIFLRLGSSKALDIPYSELHMGFLRIRMIRTGVSFHFKLTTKNDQKKMSWDITDGNIQGTSNETLYSWLKDRVDSDELRNWSG